MSVWVVIPVRISSESKSRLAAALDPRQREALVEAMLERVLAAARSARNIAQVRLLGTITGRFGEVGIFDDPGGGLNPASASALAEAEGLGARRVILIHADLPLITSRDLELLAAAPETEIAIAPDRHGTGTNAISLPLPQARGFSFAFGRDSFARHRAEAERLGLKFEEIRSPGLAKDIDEPDDLPDAGDLLNRSGEN